MPPAPSTAMTVKRIHREVADAKKEDLGSITLAPSTDNLFRWTGTIPGPQGSPYEGGVFNINIQLANDYPFSAPKVTFVTRIYHMNISDKGNICIDILKQNWSPALSLFKVMLSLSSLLTDPNPQDPLVPSIATEYLRNRVQHDRTARRWTELYARSPASVLAPSPIASSSTSSTRVPTPTSTSTSTPTISTSTTQASGSRKGKSRTSTNQPAHGSGSSNVLAETIDISDSDDELSQSPPTRKRPRGTPNEVDIDLVEAEQRAARRRRTGGGGSRVPSVSRGSRGSGSIVGAGEVIVIDD
ncbi:ubiquitin-conjugating enzyme/RWD-like protein [Suillus fuscotomentosus]|uniref:E2 ubiquitin-conjugating enzyme n=1 Tax=Suillus fuscotomentosus TaxID=1912939 RepID=A0AAD4EBJ3_9AGAM|nr:ubiquitin-conjugating enzyme/RWD-like protein [Suillus fuscotomentosus]KAG1903248.1 ubiquitin-conjugating enzyme/RWD-like protein [Suillus fuscotomentosus]